LASVASSKSGMSGMRLILAEASLSLQVKWLITS
jgi:hypothetical protein